MYKYPRTRHIRGSRTQPGDEDLTDTPFAELQGLSLVVEEKVDGANSGISFDANGNLLLQSRGHYLTGGGRERHFDRMKRWAWEHAAALQVVLADRYVMYGEWLHAKHTIFYDRLPSHFLEFDLLDTRTGEFLSTPRRRELLGPLATIVRSVPVLHEGTLANYDALTSLVGQSAFVSGDHADYLARFRSSCERAGVDVDRRQRQTDLSREMEGLYIKVEIDGVVTARYKWIRESFLQIVQETDSHWQSRPIVRNVLAEDAL